VTNSEIVAVIVIIIIIINVKFEDVQLTKYCDKGSRTSQGN